MDAYDQDPKNLRESPGGSEMAWDEESWRRWDDHLVEDFSRWVIRAGRACFVFLCVALAGLITFWIWKIF